MNLPINTNSGELTMSSREISELVESRHDKVKQSIERLTERGVISFTPMGEKSSGGRPGTAYLVNKRDSYVVVAQLSPEFTARLVDRWQELEQQVRLGFNPNNEIEVLENLLLTKKKLAHQAVLLEQATAERDQAIKTKGQISSRREAVAMGRLSAAMKKVRKLEGMNTDEATVTAVEKALGEKLGKQAFRPLKNWCAYQGVTASDVPCPRYKSVKAWPAGAWLECYGVDLAELFGKEVV